jgi:hypothetical protein
MILSRRVRPQMRPGRCSPGADPDAGVSYEDAALTALQSMLFPTRNTGRVMEGPFRGSSEMLANIERGPTGGSGPPATQR